MVEKCIDKREKLIQKYKDKLLEGTNIHTSQKEIEVIDNILFRLWQMGWLRVLEDNERIERGYYSQLEKSRDMLAEYMMNEPLVEAIKLSNSGQKDDFKTHNKVIDSLMKEQDELSKKYLRLLEENEQLKAQFEKMEQDEKISVSRKKLLKIIKDWVDCDFCRSVNIEENCKLKCIENKLKFLEAVE